MNKLTALRTAETALQELWNAANALSAHYDAETGDLLNPGHGIIEQTITSCVANAYAEHDNDLDARKQIVKDLNAYITELGSVADALGAGLSEEEDEADARFGTEPNDTHTA